MTVVTCTRYWTSSHNSRGEWCADWLNPSCPLSMSSNCFARPCCCCAAYSCNRQAVPAAACRLNSDLVQALAGCFTLYNCPPNMLLYSKDAVCDEMHVVLSGQVGPVGPVELVGKWVQA
jgi:hypothetical protein